MEESVCGIRLGILSYCIVGNQGSPTTPPFFLLVGTPPFFLLVGNKNYCIIYLYIFIFPIMVIKNRPMKIDLSLMVCFDFTFF